MSVVNKEKPESAGRRPAVTLGRSRARRDQLISVAVMVVCLGLILAMHPMLREKRLEIQADPLTKAGERSTEDALRQLSIDFPRLTLGGFRGILAMVLWQNAEEAKNNRQWMELNSMYNVIGKLEPYFVTVYVFNAWNQAYNLSAQWHSVENKYEWVLEGLDHLYQGEQYNPGNPDIILEQAQMYFMKLGTSFERISYRQFWRDNIAHQYELQDGLTMKPGAKADEIKAFETHRKVRAYILRPEFNAELREDPANPAKRGYGIRVKGLNAAKPEETMDFQYGVSPFYFAYVEYRRCLASGQPTTTGRKVIDAFPAMSLRLWCRDDVYFCQTRIREMFADGPANGKIDDFDAKVFELRDCFRNVEVIAPKAVDEFALHLQRYPRNENIHRKHMFETLMVQAVGAAEHEMFEGLVRWQAEGRKMTPAARKHLEASLPKYSEAITATILFADKLYPIGENGANPDRADITKYAKALQERSDGVRKMLNAQPGEEVDWGFLRSETVER